MADASRFQYRDHKIPKLSITIPENFHPDEMQTIAYFANYSINYGNGAWLGTIVLGFQQRTSQEDDAPVLFEIVCIGNFLFQAEKSDQSRAEFIDFLQKSGAATLIPIERAAMLSAGAIAGYPNICVIPNINVYSLQWAEVGNGNG